MVLAHGSGIDDILLFVVPVGLAMFALRTAERRARQRQEAEESSSERHPEADSAPYTSD